MGVTEYAPFGDLLGYLRKSRGLRDTYYNDPDIKANSSLSPKQLVGFSWDIANGMEFLSSKKVSHVWNTILSTGTPADDNIFGDSRSGSK